MNLQVTHQSQPELTLVLPQALSRLRRKCRLYLDCHTYRANFDKTPPKGRLVELLKLFSPMAHKHARGVNYQATIGDSAVVDINMTTGGRLFLL